MHQSIHYCKWPSIDLTWSSGHKPTLNIQVATFARGTCDTVLDELVELGTSSNLFLEDMAPKNNIGKKEEAPKRGSKVDEGAELQLVMPGTVEDVKKKRQLEQSDNDEQASEDPEHIV